MRILLLLARNRRASWGDRTGRISCLALLVLGRTCLRSRMRRQLQIRSRCCRGIMRMCRLYIISLSMRRAMRRCLLKPFLKRRLLILVCRRSEQSTSIHTRGLICSTANFAAFEIDDSVLANLREYALANSLFWVSNIHPSPQHLNCPHLTTLTNIPNQALAEGHACEISARRNAMDVSIPLYSLPSPQYSDGDS